MAPTARPAAAPAPRAIVPAFCSIALNLTSFTGGIGTPRASSFTFPSAPLQKFVSTDFLPVFMFSARALVCNSASTKNCLLLGVLNLVFIAVILSAGKLFIKVSNSSALLKVSTALPNNLNPLPSKDSAPLIPRLSLNIVAISLLSGVSLPMFLKLKSKCPYALLTRERGGITIVVSYHTYIIIYFSIVDFVER